MFFVTILKRWDRWTKSHVVEGKDDTGDEYQILEMRASDCEHRQIALTLSWHSTYYIRNGQRSIVVISQSLILVSFFTPTPSSHEYDYSAWHEGRSDSKWSNLSHDGSQHLFVLSSRRRQFSCLISCQDEMILQRCPLVHVNRHLTCINEKITHMSIRITRERETMMCLDPQGFHHTIPSQCDKRSIPFWMRDVSWYVTDLRQHSFDTILTIHLVDPRPRNDHEFLMLTRRNISELGLQELCNLENVETYENDSNLCYVNI